MNVKVTWANIADGEARSCRTCPIALAITRLLPSNVGYRVLVGSEDVDITFRCSSSDRYELPATAQRFIDDFDEKKPVRPFIFRLIPTDA